MSARQRLLNDGPQMEPCCGYVYELFGNCFGSVCCCMSCGCCCNPYKSVNIGQRGIITRFGSVRAVVADGLHYVNPITEQMSLIDTRTHAKKLASQSVLTKDKIPITIDGVVYYHIARDDVSIIASRASIDNVAFSVDELAHASLRCVVGGHTLHECLNERQRIALEITAVVTEKCSDWGVVITDIQIIDITIPQHIQQMLSSAAIAESEANAKLIMARADVQAAHLLREAADQINTPAALQIRMLDTYRIMAESDNTKLIFLPPLGQGVSVPTMSMVNTSLTE